MRRKTLKEEKKRRKRESGPEAKAFAGTKIMAREKPRKAREEGCGKRGGGEERAASRGCKGKGFEERSEGNIKNINYLNSATL